MRRVRPSTACFAWCEVVEKEFDRNFAAWHSGGLTLEKDSETVVTLASTLRPCEVGRWTQAARNILPVLLGQIFAYFTISKSGQSHDLLKTYLISFGNGCVLNGTEKARCTFPHDTFLDVTLPMDATVFWACR